MIGVEALVKTFKSEGYSECSPNYKGSFLLKASSKCTISSEAETLCDELAKDNFRPNYPGLRQGIQNTIVRNTFLEQPATPCKSDVAEKGDGTERNRRDAEKGSNNTCERHH